MCKKVRVFNSEPVVLQNLQIVHSGRDYQVTIDSEDRNNLKKIEEKLTGTLLYTEISSPEETV